MVHPRRVSMFGRTNLPYHNVSTYIFMFAFSACLSQTAASQHNAKSMPASSSGYQHRGAVSYHNLTNTELAHVLRNRGFRVQEFEGERPLVRIGDIVYLPEQVMPELGQARFSSMFRDSFWIIDGVPKVYYFFDTKTKPDTEKKETIKKATGLWANQTCIQFVQLDDNPCKTHIGHSAICVDNQATCSSFMGMSQYHEGQFPQIISVGGCYLQNAAHEFGHALGNTHTQSRPDRDSYLFVKWENFNCEYEASGREAAVKSRWSQSQCEQGKNLVDLPVPYDYESIMHYASTDLADDDERPTLIIKDSNALYIPEYTVAAWFYQSHYDLYTVNTLYGCVKTWTNSCAASGKQPPKCKNLGYVNKDCKCKCPRAFAGDTCETKVGSSLFPPLKKVNTVHVDNTQLVDFSKYPMRSDRADGNYEYFQYYQFFNVIVHGRDEAQKVTIVLPTLEHINQAYLSAQNYIINTISLVDCIFGMMLLWGVSSTGKLRRVCSSAILNNEPNGIMFRGKTHHLDWLFHSATGLTDGSTSATNDLMRFKMQVEFEGSPAKTLETKKVAPPGTKKPNMRALAAAAARNAGIGIAIAVILILGGTGAGVAWYMRSRATALADADKPADGDSSQEASSNTPSVEQSNEGDDDAGQESHL